MRLLLHGCRYCGGELLPDITPDGRPCYVCLRCGVETATPVQGEEFPRRSRRCQRLPVHSHSNLTIRRERR